MQLVGVSHPNPARTEEFRAIDLKSGLEAVAAAAQAAIKHFVYVSVAHPAPIMKAYIQARVEVEETIRASGLHATILRPLYVLGPGRRWPYLIMPVYWILRIFPRTRDSALRLGLVTRDQMRSALTQAIENPSTGIRVLEVPQIRSSA